MSDDLDPNITQADLVAWLRAKYKRHGEIEDSLCADRMEALEAELQTSRELHDFQCGITSAQAAELERVGQDARRQEREECARLCEAMPPTSARTYQGANGPATYQGPTSARDCAAAIRRRIDADAADQNVAEARRPNSQVSFDATGSVSFDADGITSQDTPQG
jgi:citrate synthase